MTKMTKMEIQGPDLFFNLKQLNSWTMCTLSDTGHWQHRAVPEEQMRWGLQMLTFCVKKFLGCSVRRETQREPGEPGA